jgi:hypothetical protein
MTAQNRGRSRVAPDEELLIVTPDVEVKAWPFYSGTKPVALPGAVVARTSRPSHCFRCNECERGARHVTFLAPQTGPKGHFDHRRNCFRIGHCHSVPADLDRGNVSYAMSMDTGAGRKTVVFS